MRLRRLCFAILALRFFLIDPIGLCSVLDYLRRLLGLSVLVDDFVQGVFDDAFGTE